MIGLRIVASYLEMTFASGRIVSISRVPRRAPR